MTRLPLFLMVTLFAVGCRDSEKRDPAPVSFFVGTYTQGESQGIYTYQLYADGSLKKVGLMAEADNPSFLAFSPGGDYLLAVNEVSDENRMGYVSSFKIGKDTLSFVDQKPSGGAHPCHVVTNGEGFVVVANYTGGNMGLLKIEAGGELSDLLDVQRHQGKGPHPRQEGPHAHSGWFTRDGRIISVDLGTDQLWISEVDPKTNRFQPEDTLSMEPGAGPRHLAMHPQKPWMYVINELSSSVSLIRERSETGKLEIAQTSPTLPESFSGENTCADIHISQDGKFLYASNRGDDSIAIFSIDPESGTLSAIGHEPTRGETPRNFSLSPDGKFLLVANQNTNTIVSFKRDGQTGLLSFQDEIGAPSPVCILFAP